MMTEQQRLDGPEIMLTDRDHAILRGIAVHGGDGRRDYLALMAAKLAQAFVVAEAELPPTTARLGSRVRYQVGSGGMLEHTLIIGARHEIPGQTRSLRTLHGLALIGMSSGQSTTLVRADGSREVISVEAILVPRLDDPPLLPEPQREASAV